MFLSFSLFGTLFALPFAAASITSMALGGAMVCIAGVTWGTGMDPGFGAAPAVR